jgi:hypothetical protein
VLSTGGPFTATRPLRGAIAYLQTGKRLRRSLFYLDHNLSTGSCGFNGEGCTLVETTLLNATTDGSGSSTDISLIPP